METKSFSSLLESCKDIRVLVIGDVMLDRYLRGSVNRRSPEADVPVLDHQLTSTKLGGAANVALNFKALGCEVSLISICGNDDGKNEIAQLFDSSQIEHQLLACDDRPTTVKTRVIADNNHLLRVDFESTEGIDEETEQNVLRVFKSNIQQKKPDILVLQDYNKGLLTERIIKDLIDQARSQGIFVAVDPKKENFWQYENVDLFKPNLRETEDAMERTFSNEAEWKVAASGLSRSLNSPNIALTLGSEGMVVQNEGDSQYIRAEPVEVVDVCGAGDAVLAIVTLMFWQGRSLEEIGHIGNVVGGKICSYSGVEVISPTFFSEI